MNHLSNKNRFRLNFRNSFMYSTNSTRHICSSIETKSSNIFKIETRTNKLFIQENNVPASALGGLYIPTKISLIFKRKWFYVTKTNTKLFFTRHVIILRNNNNIIILSAIIAINGLLQI